MIILVFFSCRSEEEIVVIPDDVLNVQEMISMTIEINLIKAAHDTRLIIGPKKENRINSYFKSVFKEKGITQEVYSNSYDWYTEHPDFFTELYNGVVEELSKRHVEAMREVSPNID
ncbi:MAG: DUF4296 domain-containing protein [Bacteroidetes bacterium]|nr:DUF4296 domain-containing protein [Bacteroidota bacterium]